MGFRRTFSLPGVSTALHGMATASTRRRPRPQLHQPQLADTVRRMIAHGYQSTIAPGDVMGPVAWHASVASLRVVETAAGGYHTIEDAEQAASVASYDGRPVAVILYDRVFNVAQVDMVLEGTLASELNEQAALRRRYSMAHAAIDGRAPMIVAVADHGYPTRVATSGTSHQGTLAGGVATGPEATA